ncbi:MAG: hypothetical protein CMH23_10470 [Methylophaga sp.]|uniref:hypothetical protein n=1 Tax=Methylophaga sp. TaxID=2024840 RepID=UPI000C8F50E8|nr:hypothetical protein [Methylophaga sp.]MBN46883.1 hypothetical protein [Methylophaga sp.]|tara:strand:+ start:4278 stop:4607 length:330 start_codon:yes stop_codon:yes gene_type:complete
MGFPIPIISELVGLGREWISGKQKIKAAKVEAESKVIVNSAENLADWEKIQAKNAGDSWKDEYWTVVLSIPVILCFFVALSSTPDWYQYLIGAAILSGFGIRVGKIFKR